MTEREFCYWLQGMLEIGGVAPLDERQVQIIKDHLATVFAKVTPDRPLPPPFRHPFYNPNVVGDNPKPLIAIC